MSDLISRQAAIEAIRKYADIEVTSKPRYLWVEKAFKTFNDDIVRDISKLPSAQLERKAGKWEHQNRCSECGFGVLLNPYMLNLDTGEYTLQYKFCPNCGAKMERGKVNEID